MPNARIDSGDGSGAGGGGLHFRSPLDVFADNSARSTYFTTTDATAFRQFVTDRSLAIIIGTQANPTAFQTYTGAPGAAYDDSLWLNRIDAVQGLPGDDGDDGDDGTPGGGALEILAVFDGDLVANTWADGGFDWPTAGWVVYYVGNHPNAFWLALTPISGNDGPSEGTIGQSFGSGERRRVNEPDAGGVAGDLEFGINVSGRALVGATQANTGLRIRFYRYVPSAVQAGTSEARVRELIVASDLSDLQGQVTDAQIPDVIMRDAELTAAAIRNLLGLTAAEVDDLLTGASISGRVITYQQNDGSTTTITLPADMVGDMADGVVASGAFNSSGTELILTLDTGSTVTIGVPALLRQSLTETRVQELIDATDLSSLQGQVTDAQIPDVIMRDAELTAAAVQTLLGLTDDEVNDLFTGASIAGNVITYQHNDGTVETITIPSSMAGGMFDGVTNGASFSADGTTLTISRSVGADIVVSVPALLRGGITVAERQKLAGIADDANRLIPYKIGNIYIASSSVPTKPSNNEGTVSVSGITVAPVGWQLTRPEATAALPYVYDCHVYGYETNGAFGIQYGTPNRTDRYIAPGGGADGTLLFGMGAPADSLGIDGDAYLNVSSGGFYSKDGGTWTLRYTDMTGGVMPVGDHTRRGAISEDTTLTAAEINTGTSGTTQMVTMPTWTGGRRYLFIGVPSTEDDITGISSGGIDIFTAWVRVSGVIEGHKWWRTVDSQSDVASGVTYRITE